ncbi:MAG: hypothetical protein WBB46_10890 [Candidatus Deferrimicrobiaceae bacterium]
MCRSTNRSEPEVWFRIIHIAQEGNNSSPVADYREKTVEITLGPKGTFEIGDIAIVTRREPTGRAWNAVLSRMIPGTL